jgi:hypothetical protein
LLVNTIVIYFMELLMKDYRFVTQYPVQKGLQLIHQH